MEEKIKYHRPQEEIKCNSCGITFKKDISEIKRNLNLGVGHYCSRSCVRKGRVSNKLGNPKNLIPDNIKDKYTGLREHLTRTKNRGKEVNIDLDDLLEIWESQNGICPYTGIKLLHPKDSKDKQIYFKASLDRIDSSLGYVKGNIQFISAAANFAKGSMSHEDMIEFCKLISYNWK
jgi:hypothetical protein